MDEEEWLARETLWDWSCVPTSWLREGGGERRIFLFLAAYLPRLMFDQFCPACRHHLPLFEKHAEESRSQDEWRAASRADHVPVFAGVPCQTRELFRAVMMYLRGIVCPAEIWGALVRVHGEIEHQIYRHHWPDPDKARVEAHRTEIQEIWRDGMCLLKEIAGNPFRPVEFDSAWRTVDVMLLARGIYDEKAFDRMPILADAMQDAGCESAEILNHLRDPHATHVRGCWALDLVLEKE
jgi:hypothetical protein